MVKRSLKGKAVIQYREKPLSSFVKNEQGMEMQKVIEDIQHLEFVVQNIITRYSNNNEIKQDLKTIKKQISLLYNKYSCCI